MARRFPHPPRLAPFYEFRTSNSVQKMTYYSRLTPLQGFVARCDVKIRELVGDIGGKPSFTLIIAKLVSIGENWDF